MKIKKIIGIILTILFFLSGFVIIAITESIITALIAFGVTILIIGMCALAWLFAS